MPHWMPSPAEFIREIAKHWFYGLVIAFLGWFVTFIWAAIDNWSPLAVWIGGSSVGASIALIYVAIRIALDHREKPISKSIARDVWLYDALCRMYLGHWGKIPIAGGNLDLGANGFEAIHDLLEKARQLAYEGQLPIWGKRPGYLALWEKPEPDFWQNNHIDYLSVTSGEPTDLRAVPNGLGSQAVSLRDLMTSTSATEAICKDSDRSPPNDINALRIITGSGEPFEKVAVNQYGTHRTIFIGVKNTSLKRITNCRFYRTYIAFTNDSQKTLLEGPFSLDSAETRYISIAMFNETKAFPHADHLIGLSMHPAAFGSGIMQPRLPPDRRHVISFAAESTDSKDAMLHCELYIDAAGRLKLSIV